MHCGSAYPQAKLLRGTRQIASAKFTRSLACCRAPARPTSASHCRQSGPEKKHWSAQNSECNTLVSDWHRMQGMAQRIGRGCSRCNRRRMQKVVGPDATFSFQAERAEQSEANPNHAPRHRPDPGQQSPNNARHKAQTKPRPSPDKAQTKPRPSPDKAQTKPRLSPDQAQTKPRSSPD